MRGAFLSLVGLAAAASAVPAQAMNWCSLPQITPRFESDFEKLAPTVAALTGCARQSTDSAHRAKWVCEDNPATPDKFETVHIHFIREPGQGIHLLVLSLGMTDLNVLRRCGLRDLRDGEKFSAGNVAYRDRISFGFTGPRLTLTSILDKGMAAIVSDTKSYGEDDRVKGLWNGLYGITVVDYPSTGVKLAGVSPISTDVYGIVAAFEGRGSTVLSSNDTGESFPKWTLSPPVGLGGVREVVIEGFVRHLLRADYILESTADYERFIGLLDAEYGRSERSSEKGCIYRWWDAGRMSIRGEHCPGKSDSLRFFNDIAGDQLEQVAAKMETDKANNSDDPKKPVIDDDMF